MDVIFFLNALYGYGLAYKLIILIKANKMKICCIIICKFYNIISNIYIIYLLIIGNILNKSRNYSIYSVSSDFSRLCEIITFDFFSAVSSVISRSTSAPMMIPGKTTNLNHPSSLSNFQTYSRH